MAWKGGFQQILWLLSSHSSSLATIPSKWVVRHVLWEEVESGLFTPYWFCSPFKGVDVNSLDQSPGTFFYFLKRCVRWALLGESVLLRLFIWGKREEKERNKKTKNKWVSYFIFCRFAKSFFVAVPCCSLKRESFSFRLQRNCAAASTCVVPAGSFLSTFLPCSV